MKEEINFKLQQIGVEKGMRLAKFTIYKMRFAIVVKCWEHWRELMDDFHEKYFGGEAYYRSKMQYELKLKRLQAKEEYILEQQGTLGLSTNKSLYSTEYLSDGRKYYPAFDLTIPQWCPEAIFTFFLYLLRTFRETIRRIEILSHDQRFDNIVTLAVLANTVLMCCEHSRNSPLGLAWGPGSNGDLLHTRFEAKMELGFICLSCFFLCECLTKIIGYGFRAYIKNPANAFDFLLVVVGMAQLPVNVDLWICLDSQARVQDCENGGLGLFALRVLRIVRVLKSFARFSIMRSQVDIVVSVLMTSYSLFVLLTGFAFMFAVLGTQLFFASISVDPGDRHSIGLGTQTWVQISGLETPSGWPGLPATVTNVSCNLFPWRVTLLDSFYDFHSELGVFRICLSGDGCNNILFSILPQENFSSFTASIVTVLQIMLRSGWTNALQYSVTGSGFAFPCIYFYTIIIMWPYFLGNMCGAVLIVGFSKKFEREKYIIKTEAFKKIKMQNIHRLFKDALVSTYLSELDSLDSVAASTMSGKNAMRFRKKVSKEARNLLFLDSEKERREWSLRHDPFEERKDLKLDIVPMLRDIVHGHGQNKLDSEAQILQSKSIVNMKKSSQGKSSITADDELEIVRIQKSIAKMSDYEREMYLRDGLSNLEIGKHIAITLGAASSLLERKLAQIQNEKDKCSENLKIYYELRMQPIRIRLKEIKERMRAVQHGHQTGMAWFVLSPYHPTRNFCLNVANSVFYGYFMMCMAFASCVTLWIERPSLPAEDNLLLDAANSVLNFLFVLECLIKVSDVINCF